MGVFVTLCAEQMKLCVAKKIHIPKLNKTTVLSIKKYMLLVSVKNIHTFLRTLTHTHALTLTN
jgi:hypothetical protein